MRIPGRMAWDPTNLRYQATRAVKTKTDAPDASRAFKTKTDERAAVRARPPGELKGRL